MIGNLPVAGLCDFEHQGADQVRLHLGDLLGIAQFGNRHCHRHAGDEAIVIGVDKALGVAQSISFYIPGDDELKSVIEELEREISLAEERELTDESGSIDDQDSEEPFPGLLQAEIYTETMADLYMSQGFYADAAGVYEKLLERDRANDSLERKLERAKSYLLSEKAGFVGKK